MEKTSFSQTFSWKRLGLDDWWFGHYIQLELKGDSMTKKTYTDAQILFITAGCQDGKDWTWISKSFAKQFGHYRSPEALRRAYYRYGELPTTSDKLHDINRLKELSRTKKLNSKHAKDNRVILNHLAEQEDFLKTLSEVLRANPTRVHSPRRHPKSSKKKSRTLVVSVSDTHFGANIEKAEMQGINEFNWVVAARRMAYLAKQVCEYKPEHRKETDVVIQINGDIIAGVIHNQEHFVDLLTTQFAGALDILSQFVSYISNEFSSVKVVCTTGNHGRAMHKSDHGRATTHKWDSFEHMLYIALKEKMIERHKNVSFFIPEAPFALYKVQGHTVIQTHGDTVINVGNVGNSLNMKSINEQINNVNSSELVQRQESIEAVFVGHVHVGTVQLLNNGCTLVVNGCLSGVDPFAQSIGIFSNNPVQLICEATKDYCVGDFRMVQVKGCEEDRRLDKIIKPFDKKF